MADLDGNILLARFIDHILVQDTSFLTVIIVVRDLLHVSALLQFYAFLILRLRNIELIFRHFCHLLTVGSMYWTFR